MCIRGPLCPVISQIVIYVVSRIQFLEGVASWRVFNFVRGPVSQIPAPTELPFPLAPLGDARLAG